jgi:hypothetical protein
MRNLGAVLCLSVLAFACGGGDTLPTAPSMVRSSADSATNAPRVITVGEEVRSTLTGHGTGMLFDLTAPADGALVVRVDWNPTQGRLQLELADRLFANFPDNLSPVLGSLPVLVGGKYRVRISDGAPWDYDDLVLPFVMTTSMESGGNGSNSW